jgi:tetratricopeptide (TPR) repeat protein
MVGAATGAWNPHDGYRNARVAILKALELDPDNAEAHAVLSRIASNYDYDLETAEREIDLALSIAPNNAAVLSRAASLAQRKGEFAKAVSLFKEVATLDPLSSATKRRLGGAYTGLGQYEQARIAYSESIDLSVDGAQRYFQIGRTFLATGELESALAEMDLEPVDGFRLAGRAMVFQAMGDLDNAALELQRLIALGDRWTYEIAQAHAYFGNIDESFEWLERAFDRRDQSLASILADPLIDNIRSDPRYYAFMERLGYTDLNR